MGYPNIDPWSCFFIITLVTVINETFMLHFYMVFKVSFPFEFITTLVAVINNTLMLQFFMAIKAKVSFSLGLITALFTVIKNNIMLYCPFLFPFSMEYCPVPEGDTWRIDILGELLDSRSSITEIPGYTQKEIQDLIDFVCVS